MWNYLYFLMYLKLKEPTEYTGPEQYLADKVLLMKACPITYRANS